MVLPGGEIKPPQGHIILVCDCSNTISDDSLSFMNQTIIEFLKELHNYEGKEFNFWQFNISLLTFTDRAKWVLGPQPLPLQFCLEKLLKDPISRGDDNTTVSGFIAMRDILIEWLDGKKRLVRNMGIPFLVFFSDMEFAKDQDSYISALLPLLSHRWIAENRRFAIKNRVAVPTKRLTVENEEHFFHFLENDKELYISNWQDYPERKSLNTGQYIARIYTYGFGITLALTIKDEPMVSVVPAHTEPQLKSLEPSVMNDIPWYIILLCDCSESMGEKGKIQELNRTIMEFISVIKKEFERNPRWSAYFGVIKYSSGAGWHIPFGTPINDVQWTDLQAGGGSDLGAGLRLLSQTIKKEIVPKRVYRPLLILLGSNNPTDDFRDNLNHLFDGYQGEPPMRYAIAIGQNAPVNILTEFTKNKKYPYFLVKNPVQLRESMQKIIQIGYRQLDDDAEIVMSEAHDNQRLKNSSWSSPGGELSSRTLHFYWIIDCSDSMRGDKIQFLNNAIKECLPEFRSEADKNPDVQVYLRSLSFSTGARWLDDHPIPLNEYRWHDLTAGGKRDLSAALNLITDELHRISTSPIIPPVLVLLTDGTPTDDYKAGLKKLRELPLAVKSVRIGIAIGNEAGKDVLKEFTGKTGFILEANSPHNLVKYIHWTSIDIPVSNEVPERQLQIPPKPQIEPADPKSSIMKIFSDLPIKDISTDPQFFITLLGMECGRNPAVFERVFLLLRDDDPKIRSLASEILGDPPKSMEKVIDIYQTSISCNPEKAVLAGRVLGRKSSKMISQEHPMIHADNTRMFFGIPVAFAPCVCGHCGEVNDGIPVPEKGLYIGYYGQADKERGAYTLPVLCDFCGKTFYIAWDTDPR
jgi:uncharacterized protein YegL